MIKNKRISESM